MLSILWDFFIVIESIEICYLFVEAAFDCNCINGDLEGAGEDPIICGAFDLSELASQTVEFVKGMYQ